MRIVLDTNISEDLVCFACKALNGDSELPCWSLTNDSMANQSILSEGIGYSSSVPSDGGLYRQTCNSTQRFCKVWLRTEAFILNFNQFGISDNIHTNLLHLFSVLKVHRVEYLPEKEQDGEVDMSFKEWSIERGCDSHCDPEKSNFCVEMGARTKVLYCTSCCEGNLCNVDNKASPFNLPINILLINQIFFIFVLYVIIRWIQQ